MLRAALLWMSERDGAARFIKRNGMAGRFAARFVAGDTADAALGAIRELNTRGIAATLDLLGEGVRRPDEARRARDEYLSVLSRIAATGLTSNISVKLTQMGLDVDQALCVENVTALLERAKALGSFVRIDMEGSAYTDRTLRLFHELFHPTYGDHVGVVIQSALRRSEDDVERLIRAGARVRLCKGAYQEPPAIAFPAKSDVDRTYLHLLERLLAQGNYPAIATHDENLITRAKAFAAGCGLAAARFEFQMIYGVRRDLQQALRREGYTVRVYVPYGEQWYPYLMRRLAERPANVAFMLTSLLKESVRRA